MVAEDYRQTTSKKEEEKRSKEKSFGIVLSVAIFLY
jgi:hypothetical protein